MRDLNPYAVRSLQRDQHRAKYAAYMASAEWFRRREQWAAEESARLSDDAIRCKLCNDEWSLKDDLHHVDYTRLGSEQHDDLWPVCRACHDALHERMESSKSWRKLPRRLANELALNTLRAERDGSTAATRRRRAVEGLKYYR